QHIPQIAALAQTIVDGIERAYHPDVNPNKTASDYAALSNLATQFYEFLRETGVGALPIFEPPQTSSDVGVNTDADAMALDIISAPPLPEVSNITNMTEEELRTKLNADVNVQYTQQRRVVENANI
ncbi:4585_t:CDS:2, partial [Acaulospora colombiana]